MDNLIDKEERFEAVLNTRCREYLCYQEIKSLIEAEHEKPKFLAYCGELESATSDLPLFLQSGTCALLFGKESIVSPKSKSLIIFADCFFDKIRSASVSKTDFERVCRDYSLLRSIDGIPAEKYLKASGARGLIKAALESICRVRNLDAEISSANQSDLPILAVQLTRENELKLLPLERTDIKWWIRLSGFDDWFTLGRIVRGEAIIRPKLL